MECEGARSVNTVGQGGTGVDKWHVKGRWDNDEESIL